MWNRKKDEAELSPPLAPELGALYLRVYEMEKALEAERKDRVGDKENSFELKRDLDRIGAQVQMLLLIPGLKEVPEVPEQVIPAVPAHYDLKRK